MAENQSTNKIIESNVEGSSEDDKSILDHFESIGEKGIPASDPVERVKRNTAQKPKFSEGDDIRNDTQKAKLAKDCSKTKDAMKSKLAESDGSINDAKESNPTEGDDKISHIKESNCTEGTDESDAKELNSSEGDDEIGGLEVSKAARGYDKISGAKESMPAAEGVGKINNDKESMPAEGDGKISGSEESESAAGSCCDVEKVKQISVSSGDYEISPVESEAVPFLFDDKSENINMKCSTSPTHYTSAFNSNSEAKSASENSQFSVSNKVLSPKQMSDLEGNLEKATKYAHMPEFYKLGLIGSPEVEVSRLDINEKPPKDNLASASSCESIDKPEGGACFNWFKRVNYSPQKFISRFRKYANPKLSKPPVSRPMISSDCHADGSFKSPGLSPISGGRQFFLAYMGNTSMDPLVDRIDYSKLAEDKIIPAFLGMHPCYDVMPTSGKVIVLSVELLVKNAFGALVTNEIKAAPLWDTGLHDFIGMLTISDFINVLRHYFYSNPEDIKDIENQTISTWRKMTKMSNEFIKINGSDSLAQATKLLIQEGVHRIPVFDEKRKCVLFVLTRKRLLQYLSYSLFEKFEKSNIKTPSFFRKTLRELQVGTYGNIATTTVDGRVIDALDLFMERKVSSLPVVDENGELKDIFEKFDVFVLAKEQTYHNLEMTVLEAITKAGNREGAVICTLDESLGTVINKFVNSKVHRIVVINERRIVIGIVSLSDILKFLVVQPLVSMEDSNISAASDIIEEGAEGAVGGSEAEISVFDSGEQDSSASLPTEESDKNNSSLSEAITDLKISSDPENPEKNLDGGDVPKSE